MFSSYRVKIFGVGSGGSPTIPSLRTAVLESIPLFSILSTALRPASSLRNNISSTAPFASNSRASKVPLSSPRLIPRCMASFGVASRPFSPARRTRSESSSFNVTNRRYPRLRWPLEWRSQSIRSVHLSSAGSSITSRRGPNRGLGTGVYREPRGKPANFIAETGPVLADRGQSGPGYRGTVA